MIRPAVLSLFAPAIVTTRASVALLLLRMFVGIAFIFHGSGKAADLTAFAAEFHIPLTFAGAAAYTQIIGGLLLVAGLCTPLAASGVASTMAVAMMELIARGERFVDPSGHSWEAPAFYLVVNILLIMMGPGRWSLDRMVFAHRVPSRHLASSSG
jgi:putative oxidoreductase